MIMFAILVCSLCVGMRLSRYLRNTILVSGLDGFIFTMLLGLLFAFIIPCLLFESLTSKLIAVGCAAVIVFVLRYRCTSLSAPDRYHAVAAGLGGLFAFALLTVLHYTSFTDFSTTTLWGSSWLALAEKSAPALVIAYLGAGILDAFMPHATVRWLQRGRASIQSLRGILFGLPLPVCSCGVVPLYQSIVQRGAPLSAAMAFLVATPEIGVDAVLLSIPLLGMKLTIVRVLCAAIVAWTTGWITGRYAKQFQMDATSSIDTNETETKPLGEKFKQAAKTALSDSIGATGPWILVGLFIAALGSHFLDDQLSRYLPWGLDIVVLTVIGMPMYVCASGATPLGAMLLHKGFSPGATIAFLLTGPATNATTFGILSQLHHKRVALVFALTCALVTMSLGLIVNATIGPLTLPPLTHAHEHRSLVQTLSLGFLGLLFCGALIRRGPRFLAGKIVSSWNPKLVEPPHACCAHKAQETKLNTPEPQKQNTASCCHKPTTS